MRHTRTPREAGSIPLTLLVAIILGGLVVVLVGTTITGQQKVRHDRNFQLAINGADAGVNQAVSVITQLPTDSTDTTLSSIDLGPDAVSSLGDDDTAFEWTAVKDTPISWRIDAKGQRGEVVRNVEALAVRDATFFLAAFADIGFVMRGNNEVRSYSQNGVNTGSGAVGSNGSIEIQGASSWADIFMLMGDGASCSGNRCTNRPIVGFDDPYDLGIIEDNIQASIDAQCGGAFTSYNANTAAPLQGGVTYCFSSVSLGNHNTFPIENHSYDNPVVILMTGNLTTGNHSSTNCAAGCSMANKPDARSLQIYSLGSTISLGNQSEISAAIAAPAATCQGNPSNAQLDLFGAIVCTDLSNQGGWNFYFDERLLNLGSGEYAVKEWREEVGGSSWPTN